MFPPEKQVSPVADQLRQILASAPWARVGLGLPVVSILQLLHKNLFILQSIHHPITSMMHIESIKEEREAKELFVVQTRVTLASGVLSKLSKSILQCNLMNHCLTYKSIIVL